MTDSTKAIIKHMHDYDRLVMAMKEIAAGRLDCGRPLAAETSRQIARKVLVSIGEGWPTQRKDAP